MIFELLLRWTYPQIANKILKKDLDIYALECLSKNTYPQLSFKIYRKLLDIKLVTLPLEIPLNFWFNTSPELALPIVALSYHDIKINIEFNNINNLSH